MIGGPYRGARGEQRVLSSLLREGGVDSTLDRQHNDAEDVGARRAHHHLAHNDTIAQGLRRKMVENMTCAQTSVHISSQGIQSSCGYLHQA